MVAPWIDPALRGLPQEPGRLVLVERRYARDDIGDALLVIATTDDRRVNAAVAADAHAARRLVFVADVPGEGNCLPVAAHRTGDLLVAVSAAGLPAVASRVRDAIGGRFDERYAEAVEALATLRERLLTEGRRDDWERALNSLVTREFCDVVEHGAFPNRVAAWR